MTEASLKPTSADNIWQRFLDALPPGGVCAVAGLIALLLPVLLFRYSMIQVSMIAVGLVGASIIASCPYLGLLVFVGLLYLRPEEQFPALAGARFTLIVSLLALFAWLVNGLLAREQFRFQLPAVRSFLGFVAVAIGSTLLSGSDMLSDVATEMLRLFALFILVIHLANSESRLRTGVIAVVLFTAILGARTIWQFQNGEALVDSDGFARAEATGIFADPNDLALAMAMAVPLALGIATSREKWWNRLITLSAVPILIWTIFLTNSRGGMLALIAGVFLFFRQRLGRAGLIVGAFAVVAFLSMGPSRLSMMDSDEESAQGRVCAWQAGMDMLGESPVWGVGRGQFYERDGMTAHNSLILCLAEVGMLGTAMWIGIFYFAFRENRLAGAFSQPEDPPSRSGGGTAATATGRYDAGLLQTSLITFMVGAFWLSRTFTPELYFYLGLTVAAAQVVAERAGQTLPAASGRDVVKIALLALASVPFMMFFIRLWG